MKFVRLFLYLALIVAIGGLGCWISLVQYRLSPEPRVISGFLGNLGTFSISVAVMAFADFLLMSGTSYSSTRALLLFVWMSLAVIASATTLVIQAPFMLGVAIAAGVMALVEWIIVNVQNPSFEDATTDPYKAMGEESTK